MGNCPAVTGSFLLRFQIYRFKIIFNYVFVENDGMKKIEKLFNGWDETIILSCLQGVMGRIYTNSTESAAIAVLGDFAFLAGTPSYELLHLCEKDCKWKFIIMVPQSRDWECLIEKNYGDKAEKATRYAIKKEKDIFDKDRLKQAVSDLPAGYELRFIGEYEYNLCMKNVWSKDFVAQFKDYAEFKNLGLGVVAFKDGEPVSGASSYSRYKEGIEIEVDTEEYHRRKGLAYSCAAKLILECLDRGLYPSWDAQNKNSVALAEKLGYHFSHEYTVYNVK